jgi:hypothetical protein
VERVHEIEETADSQALPAHSAALEAAPVERVLALQRAVGNRAVSRMIARAAEPLRLARWSLPIQGGVPTGTKHTTSFATFINIIKDEEAKLPVDVQLNTKLMITKLRKLFYGSGGWDSHLIPDASAIAPLYKFKEVEDSSREVEAPGPNVLEFVDTHPELEGAPSVLTRPADIQEVLMPNGDFVDVGHVLAGLDALNHPDKVAPYYMYEMSRNVDAVTWAGDLGSILAEWTFERAKKGSQLSDSERQATIDQMAPVQDMLGNIDAYVIGKTYYIRDEGPSGSRVNTPGRRVSDILTDYYTGSGGAGPAARNKRFTIFAERVGLGALSGGKFVNEDAWLNKYELEIGKAGALYVGATARMKKWGLTFSVGAKLGMMDAVRDSGYRRDLLEEFVNQLKAKVAGETSTP